MTDTACLPLGAPIAALGFLAVALVRRSRALAFAALVAGVVLALEEPFHSLSNGLVHVYPKLPPEPLEQYSTSIILVVLGAGLVLAGTLALRRERTR